MTEQEWRSCDDPVFMLQNLAHGTVSDRKLRLFACACCRRVWNLLSDARSRTAVDVAERFIEGTASRDELEEAARAAASVIAAGPELQWNLELEMAEAAFRTATLHHMPLNVIGIALRTSSTEDGLVVSVAERSHQVVLLRDILGPSCPPLRVLVDQAWLRSDEGLVPAIAREIYNQSRWDLIPMLADALEKAGCSEETILSHCRSGQQHVRGCWIVDLLLAKT
jgi:hypothetical protein